MTTGGGRIRWAAVGAAVAVTLGAGIIPVARAVVDSGDRNVFVPISPCRLMDTRGGSSNVGPRSTPIGPGESYEAAVRGANGQCTIPDDATAVATNTTVLGGSQSSFLTLYPANAGRPTASNLNWTAGQSATPNQVTVGLSPEGRIRIYNDRGTVNVVVDIVGYFATHRHDDRYYPRAEHDALVSSSLAAYGSVNTAGNAVAGASRGGSWTSQGIAPGRYLLRVMLPCPAPTPIVIGSSRGTHTFSWDNTSLGTCTNGVREVGLTVSTREATVGAESSTFFSFSVYQQVP